MTENRDDVYSTKLAEKTYKADILLLEDGVAHTQAVSILEVSPHGAWVEVESKLQNGQKLGLVIHSSDLLFLKMFGLSDVNLSSGATVKTQGVAHEVQTSVSGNSELYSAHIVFTGNIRVVSAE